MKKLNLKNSALITLILSLLYGYLITGYDFLNVPRDSYFERILSGIIVDYGTYFILGWIIPFIPYSISLFIDWTFDSKSQWGYKLFKLLWYLMNFLQLFLIIMELTNPLLK